MTSSIGNKNISTSMEAPLYHSGQYQVDTEYYMLDYLNNDTISHVRRPFLRSEQLFDTLRELYSSIEFGAKISSIRVLSERFLDEPYVNPKVAKAAIDAGIEDAKNLDVTTREVLFGLRYEQFARSFRNIALSNAN